MITNTIPDIPQIAAETTRIFRSGTELVPMQRHARPLDGSIPLAALLYDEEQVVTSQDGIGLYDG